MLALAVRLIHLGRLAPELRVESGGSAFGCSGAGAVVSGVCSPNALMLVRFKGPKVSLGVPGASEGASAGEVASRRSVSLTTDVGMGVVD